MRKIRPLEWPFAGRFDSEADAEQPRFTTAFAKNVRNRDPVTGQIRGASRSGMLLWNPDAIGTSKIKALCSTAIDSRTTEFDFTAGAETIAWDSTTPSKTSCLAGRVDRQGNVYALDGPAGIVKYNSTGRELMKIALPVADPAHVVRALWVDEQDRIFAAVSEGGDVRTARMFCVLQLLENEYHVLWTHEPGAYTEDMRVYRGSQLFAAHNYTLENKARVLIYESLSLLPIEAKRIEDVAFPINAMDVGADGAVYCTSDDNLGTASSGSSISEEDFRPGHPNMRGFCPPLTVWTPHMDPTLKIHSWYDAADRDCLDETDLEQTGSVATFDEGQQALRWRDKSGNERHWYAGSLFDTDERGPTLSKVGPGGLPALRFTNISSGPAAILNSMVTFPNASISKTTADQQRTAIPAHEDAMWAMFILMRPIVDDVAGTDPRVVFYAENDAGGGASHHGLWVNRECGGVQPGTFDLGSVSYFATTDNVDDGACAAADQFADWGFTGSTTRFTDCVLVTIVWDGQVDPNDPTKTRSLFRVNGQPVDRCEGLPFESLKPNYLAYAPTVATAAADRFNGELCEILVVGRRDRFDNSTEPKILTHDLIDFVEDHIAGLAQTDNQLARIESYMLHRRGLGHLLGGTPGPGNPADLWEHFYGQDNPSAAAASPHGPSSPPDYDGAGRSAPHEQILQRFPLVSKHDPQGKLLWVCNEETHPDTGADRGGIGYGVRARTVESDGLTHVYLVGPDAVQANTGDVAVRKIIDQGAAFSGTSGDGAWFYKFTSNRDYDYENPKIDADKFGNLYLPYFETDAAAEWSLLVFAKDGVAGVGQVLVDFLLGDDQQAHAVAVPPDALTPEYRGDLTTELAEFVYVFTRNESDADVPTVHKLRLVSTDALAAGNPQEVVTLAVVDDDIRIVTESTNVIPTGGSGVIDATAQYVQAIRAGEDIVVNDGVKLFAYKLREGVVEELTSTSAGEVPERVKYIAYWRHRLVCVLEGGKYRASRLGNIRDWNLNPGVNLAGQPLQTSTQAFNGTFTRAGEAEDSLVTAIPAHDDLLFLIGISRILRVTGDPQDGGNIHKVTDEMGGVFGDSWCIDNRGRVFMWGNKPPGLYMLQVPGDPIPLSERSLEASEFDAIDYSTHRMLLTYDPLEHGVRVYQVAWGTSTIVASWFWEERTHRLVRVPPVWQDKINDEDKQVTALAFLGGDSTRRMLVGCEDSRIRTYDAEARDDDGTAIDSLVVFDLTQGLPEGLASRLLWISVVLADDQEGAVLEIFTGETAERLGPIIEQFDLKPGRNPIFHARVKGAHIWARIRNAKTGRWAFEEGSYELETAGRVRQRAL